MRNQSESNESNVIIAVVTVVRSLIIFLVIKALCLIVPITIVSKRHRATVYQLKHHFSWAVHSSMDDSWDDLLLSEPVLQLEPAEASEHGPPAKRRRGRPKTTYGDAYLRARG